MQRTRRPLLFVLLGLLTCAVAGYLIYDHMQPQSTVPVPQKYTYQIKQSAVSAAHYEQNEFFEASGSPGSDNTVYVQKLTDYLNSELNYTYTGSTAIDLRYSYKVDAVIYSKFSGKDSSDNAPSVWTKEYSLLETVTGNQPTKVLTLKPSVNIPFAEYVAVANNFRSAYNIPVSSEVIVTYTVEVSGEANGVPFTNTQTSKIIAPLDQQLYKIDAAFNETDFQEIASKRTRQLEDIISTYELPVAVILALIGIVAIVYGFRKQIIKSPYQRELARIYRYNDGIIVKARRPVSLAHKTIVDLNSFEDLLSIEEETGSTIVANELSENATRFIITNDDTAYVFTLGGLTPKEDWGDSAIKQSQSKTPRRKIQL